MAKYSDVTPGKKEKMDEEFDAEMLALEEDDMDMEEEESSDIAMDLGKYSKEEIEEYLASLDEEDIDMEEDFSEPEMIMGPA